MPKCPKRPHASQEGQHLLTPHVNAARRSAPRVKIGRYLRRKKRYMVPYTPSLPPIYEEGGPASGGEGSASGSSQRLLRFPKPARYDGGPRHTPTHPRNDSVHVQGRRSSTKFLGIAVHSWVLAGVTVLAVVGLVVMFLGTVESIHSHNTPLNRGGLLMFMGAAVLMISVVMCNWIRGSSRWAAVRLAPGVPPI